MRSLRPCVAIVVLPAGSMTAMVSEIAFAEAATNKELEQQ